MEGSPVSPFYSRPCLEGRGPLRRLRDLPDSLLHSVLAQVSETGGGYSHALVCRKWAQVSMEAQRRIIVREGACNADSDLFKELRDFQNLRELELKEKSALRLTDRFFLGIGRTCPRLESITIPRYSSSMRAEFSSEGLLAMMSSLPGIKSIVLREVSGRGWEVPDSVSNLRSLKVLAVGSRNPSRTELALSFQSKVLKIPPSIRELSFCNFHSWDVAEEECGLQGVRLLNAEAAFSEVIPEALWAACSLRSLKLKTHQCHHLSAGVGRLTALRQLHLDFNSVTNLPDCFSTLQLLTQLRLRSIYFEALPDSLWSLPSLKHLHLDCEELRPIDSRVGQLQRLTSLGVSSNQRCNFPSSLCGHPTLRKLDLYLPGVQPCFELRASALTDANILVSRETDLSRFLRGCPSLSSLRVHDVGDASSLLRDTGLPLSLKHLRVTGYYDCRPALPSSLRHYSILETLEFVRCRSIIKLPSNIGECGRLTMLTVAECDNLRKLPLRLGTLRNLRTLHISNCPELQSLPRSVGQLSTLEELYLRDLRNFRSIPKTLGEVHRLRTLRVSGCTKLSRLPESLGQLALLTSLSVKECCLVKKLPASMSQLLSLRVLELYRLPALQSLPKGVEKTATLHSLTVHCSSLQELPSELGQLKTLRYVVIGGSSTLQHLTSSIGDLLHLKRLHLKNLRSLSGIPQEIGQLSSLRDLLIQDLPLLTSLPDSMTRLTGLAELNIEYCDSLAWVPELLENLSEISEESKEGLRRLMETGALRGVQQRRSADTRRTREGEGELGAGGMI